MDDDADDDIDLVMDVEGLDAVADAISYLPDALLESVLGPLGINELETREAFCLVVQAPSADWVGPLYKSVRRMGRWSFHCSKSIVKRGKPDEIPERLIEAMTSGGRVFGISQRPAELLPPALVTNADKTVVVPVPSPELICKVIRAVTGDLPIDVPSTLGRGLDFEEMAGCIRKGSTAAECVDRLRRASASKARADTFGDGVPGVEELSGMGAAKDWAMELVVDIESWRRGEIAFHEIGSAAAVIAGPPGVGKTALMRSLSKSTQLPLIVTSVGEWFSTSPGYLDSIIKKIDEVFSSARSVAPAIIFLDELDSVPSRKTISPRGADWWLPVITHLLTTLDTAVSGRSDQLIVVAATNHPERLDPALVRPGRFSRIIDVGTPDEEGMKGILRQHLGADLEGQDLAGAARLAAGATGAKAVDWVREARRTARLAKRPMLLVDLLDVIAPPDDRPYELVWRTAVHEAGHAVVAWLLSVGEVLAVSIVASDSIGGYNRLGPGNHFPTRLDLENLTVQILAGRAAEQVILGVAGTGSGGAAFSDLARATRTIGLLHLGTGLGTDLIYRAGPDEVSMVLGSNPRLAGEVESELRLLYARAVELVDGAKILIEMVARSLVERRHLSAEEFMEIVRDHEGRKSLEVAVG